MSGSTTGNPLISQGQLNRLVASVVVSSYPTLNVTSSYLGEEAIRIALEGEATTPIRTMTGAVMSPEPYMMANVTINLLKSQALSNQWKAQMEAISLIGDITVRPDSTILNPYDFTNCSIRTVREMTLNGRDAGWIVTVTGYYLINNNLWNLV